MELDYQCKTILEVTQEEIGNSGIMAQEDKMINIEDLSTKTVMEIKSFAKKNNINILGATKKVEILEIIKGWTPEETVEIIKEDKDELVAVFAQKHLFWNGLGNLQKGYNIVTKEASEKWTTHKAVRIATPSEVASYYGKA